MMKSELQKFDKKKVAEIQQKYKIMKKEKSSSNSMEDLREQTQRYQKALFYKNALDNGEMREEEIPVEYAEEIRNIYEEEIARMQSKMNKK